MGLTRRSFLATGSAAFALAARRSHARPRRTAGDDSTSAAPRRTTAPGSTPDEADLIFRGGPVLTSNDQAPRAEAVAVTRGIISAVGLASDVMAHKGPRTQLIDLKGHALAPGFFDVHMHTAFAIQDSWLDLGPATTKDVEGALAKLKAATASTPPGAWILGKLFDPSIMPGPPITMGLLDSVAPNHPVWILESNGHVAYANSKAFAAAGITDSTPDPPQGRYVRENGTLTGRVEEPPAYEPFSAKMPRPTPQEFADGVRRIFGRAAAAGCTCLHDCGLGSIAGAPDVDALSAIMRSDPPVRYSAFLVSSHMDTWLGMGLTPNSGNDRFRLTGIKLWSDGSNQAKTGYQREPYLNSTSVGSLNYTLEELTATMQRAHDLGWQLGVHANGDAAIDAVLQAYASVLTKTPRANHRHRIEHSSILHRDQMQKMKELAISPSFLIGHVYYWGRAFRDDILGPRRANLYDPCRSALEAGLRITLHSDYNVTPIAPLHFIETAVTRVMRDGGGVLNPDERITAQQALKAVTLDAAWQCRKDDITGSIEPGKCADFVVLEKDPTAVDPATIASIKVVETWLGGYKRQTS